MDGEKNEPFLAVIRVILAWITSHEYLLIDIWSVENTHTHMFIVPKRRKEERKMRKHIDWCGVVCVCACAYSYDMLYHKLCLSTDHRQPIILHFINVWFTTNNYFISLVSIWKLHELFVSFSFWLYCCRLCFPIEFFHKLAYLLRYWLPFSHSLSK